MKNLNDIANVDNNNSSQTVLSIKSSHVTTRHVMKKVTTQTVTSSSSSSNDVTDGENNNPFIFSSAMYQTMPARHSSARSRDKDKVSTKYYRAFHIFELAKFPNGGSILGSSQFSLLAQLPPRILLDLKVVKIDSKIIISLR